MTFSPGSIQLSGVRHRRHITLQTVPSSNSLGSYYCMKTQPMANACPNFLDSPSCMLLAYLLEFG
jgi:hypothetical protein